MTTFRAPNSSSGGDAIVYFIQAENPPGSPIKIGFTAGKSHHSRLRQLQTSHPTKLLCLATLNSATLKEEQDLHEQFSDLRLHGEWFKCSLRLLTWIQANALLTEDGHRQLGKPSTWGDEE